MTSPAKPTPNETSPGSVCTCWGKQYVSEFMKAQGAQVTPESLAALDGRLAWLDLHTRAPIVHRALVHLFTVAMLDTNDAARVGNFLLSLWSPDQYHLDLNELGFLERETNFAVRHLANFIVACEVNIREIVTYSQIEPVIAAWGGTPE